MRKLGNSDIQISPILLGTAAIGGTLWGGAEEKDSIEAICVSLENGITALDTAPVYGNSEEIVGKALKKNRDQTFIATKCGIKWLVNEKALSYEDFIIVTNNTKEDAIFRECEESLKRLDTDRIDLYQIHWPDPNTSIEESWEAMVKLKKQGKVGSIGVCNYSLEQLKQTHAIHPVDSIQLPYSLIRRDIEQNLIPFCQKNQISVLAYSPLERGLLTGKVPPERTFSEGDHRNAYDLFSLENRKLIMTALKQIEHIANSHKATLAQLVIATTMHLPGITGVIVGARNRTQALENAKALHLNLSPKERQLIVDTLHSEAIQKITKTT